MLEIEIFSDAICPWCFIGKRRLEAALTDENCELDPSVALRWRPYMLYPNLPVQGMDRAEMLRKRFGPRGDKGRVPAVILAEAASQHIALRYDLIARTPNTRMAHRLVEWVGQSNGWRAQHEIVESLFQAYFCDGKDVGDANAVAALAEPYGLRGREAQQVLRGSGELGERLNEEIDVQLIRATDLGVCGVPGYVMGGSYLLPGAQSVETMRAIIARAKEKFST